MQTVAGMSPKQASAVAALADLDTISVGVLHDCFRQFGIETVAIPAQDIARLARRHFDACILPLDDRASQTLATLRQSPDNARTVIYGISASLQQAIRFAQDGINAVFLRPVDRHSALRVVRTTYLLVLHELRRYVRVPLFVTVVLQTGTATAPASTVEISYGGLALRTTARLAVSQAVQVTVQLPHAEPLSLHAVVCWVRRDEDLAGVRFEPGDPLRLQLRQWIDNYLGED